MSTSSYDINSGAFRVVAHEGAINGLDEELSRLGVRRALVLSGRRTATSGAFQQVTTAVGERLVSAVTDVASHPRSDAIEQTARAAAEAQVDGVVALGGGSVIDTAKAVSLLLARGGNVADYFRPSGPLDVTGPVGPALVLIPLTASGAEMTPGGGALGSDGVKHVFQDPRPAPRTVLLDPAATDDVPASVFAASAMTGLAHCLEGMYSRVRSPLTNGLAVEGGRLFLQALATMNAERPTREARALVQSASVLGGLVMVNARLGVHHALCHAVAAPSGASHGSVHAALLPHSLRFNLDAAADRLSIIARAARLPESDGSDARACEALIDAIDSSLVATGLVRRLRDFGIPREALGPAAAQVYDHASLDANPRRVDGPNELLQVYEAAW